MQEHPVADGANFSCGLETGDRERLSLFTTERLTALGNVRAVRRRSEGPAQRTCIVTG